MLKGSRNKTILHYKLHWVGDIILISTVALIFMLVVVFFSSLQSNMSSSNGKEVYSFRPEFNIAIIILITLFLAQWLSFLTMYTVKTYKLMPVEGKITAALLHTFSTMFLLFIAIGRSIMSDYFFLDDFESIRLLVIMIIVIVLVLQIFTILLLFKSSYFKLQK